MTLRKDPIYINYADNLRGKMLEVPKHERERFLSEYLETVDDLYKEFKSAHEDDIRIVDFIATLETPLEVASNFKKELGYHSTIQSVLVKKFRSYQTFTNNKTFLSGVLTSLIIFLLSYNIFMIFISNIYFIKQLRNNFNLHFLIIFIISAILCIYFLSNSLNKNKSSYFFIITIANFFLFISFFSIINGILSLDSNPDPLTFLSLIIILSLINIIVFELFLIFKAPKKYYLIKKKYFPLLSISTILFITILTLLISFPEPSLTIYNVIMDLRSIQDFSIIIISNFIIWGTFASIFNIGSWYIMRKTMNS